MLENRQPSGLCLYSNGAQLSKQLVTSQRVWTTQASTSIPYAPAARAAASSTASGCGIIHCESAKCHCAVLASQSRHPSSTRHSGTNAGPPPPPRSLTGRCLSCRGPAHREPARRGASEHLALQPVLVKALQQIDLVALLEADLAFVLRIKVEQRLGIRLLTLGRCSASVAQMLQR